MAGSLGAPKETQISNPCRVSAEGGRGRLRRQLCLQSPVCSVQVIPGAPGRSRGRASLKLRPPRVPGLWSFFVLQNGAQVVGERVEQRRSRFQASEMTPRVCHLLPPGSMDYGTENSALNKAPRSRPGHRSPDTHFSAVT